MKKIMLGLYLMGTCAGAFSAETADQPADNKDDQRQIVTEDKQADSKADDTQAATTDSKQVNSNEVGSDIRAYEHIGDAIYSGSEVTTYEHIGDTIYGSKK